MKIKDVVKSIQNQLHITPENAGIYVNAEKNYLDPEKPLSSFKGLKFLVINIKLFLVNLC